MHTRQALASEKAKLERELKAIKAEKETYRDFLGERGLTDAYKQWLKANGKKGD